MHHKPYVCAFIKTHFPADLVSQIHWETFEFQRIDGRHVRADLKSETQADVLCRAEVGKGTGFFYFGIEHQSRPDPWIAQRLKNYRDHFLNDYRKAHPNKKLPLFISALYYHGQPSPFPHSLDWFDLFEDPALAKQHMQEPILIDISHREDDAIQKAPPEIAATEYIFKYIHIKDFTPHLAQALLMLRQAPSDIKQIALTYLMYGASLQKETLIKTAHQYLPFDEEYVMNIATQCEEIGIQKGILKTAKNMLMTGYDLKTIASITQLSLDTIESLQENLEGVTDTQ